MLKHLKARPQPAIPCELHGEQYFVDIRVPCGIPSFQQGAGLLAINLPQHQPTVPYKLHGDQYLVGIRAASRELAC